MNSFDKERAQSPIAAFDVDGTLTWTDSFMLFLRFVSEARFEQWCRDYARVAYPIIARSDALARLNSHLGVHDEVALVSASLAGYLEPWAQTLGVRTVLATQVEVVNGLLTGRMRGLNCRCEQKLARIREHFGEAPLIAAYGDSRGDKEMLAASQNPSLLIFDEGPANRQAILWNLYFGNLLERRARGDMS